MNNIVIIRHPQDVPLALEIVAQEPQCRVLCFDPILVDHAYYAGLKQVEFYALDTCPDYADLNRECNTEARVLEKKLLEVTKPFFPDCDIVGWQHLNLYYLILSLRWYSFLWKSVSHMLSGNIVHVIVCDTPSVYYFNSDIPSLLLIEELAACGIEYKTYHHGDKNAYPSNRILNLQGVADPIEQKIMLVHLPTCVYDLLYFNAELAKNENLIIKIQAKHFDMPVRSKYTIGLTDLPKMWSDFTKDIQVQLTNVYNIVYPKIDQYLAAWLKDSAHRHQQVHHITEIYQTQFTNWLLLTIYFMRCKPASLLLSDHDADFHGPMISFARNYNIPVFMLPHAKTVAQVDFEYSGITVLSHPMQGNKIYDPAGSIVKQMPLLYPEEHALKALRPHAEMKIGLMLNSFSLSGVNYSNYLIYVDGIARIINWCKEKNLQLMIRGKPSYSIVRLIAKHAGYDLNLLVNTVLGDISNFVNDCDLCLMYDTPTSGCIEFLRRGIPIVNPIAHSLSHAESTFTSTNFVPRADLESILLLIEPLVADENAYKVFREQQFQRYRDSFANTQALHTYL